MSHWTSTEYTHLLSPEAARLFPVLDQRIREEFNGVKSVSKSATYISYETPRIRPPFLYIVRRTPKTRHLVVRLKIHKAKIRELENYSPMKLRENRKWRKNEEYVEVNCASIDHIDHIMPLVRQAFDYNLNQERPSPTQTESMESALSSEQHAEIISNLDHVYDVVEGMANQIRRAHPPRRDESTSEWEMTDANQYAAELLDAVHKLQVVLGKDSHDENSNDLE